MAMWSSIDLSLMPLMHNLQTPCDAVCGEGHLQSQYGGQKGPTACSKVKYGFSIPSQVKTQVIDWTAKFPKPCSSTEIALSS